MRQYRSGSLPGFSAFILILKDQTDQNPGNDGGGNASGSSLQASQKDTGKTDFLHRFPDTLCQKIAEAQQGNGSPCPCLISKGRT